MRMSSNHKDLRGWAIQSIRAGEKKNKGQQNPIKRMGGGLVGETNEWIEYQSAQHKCKCRQEKEKTRNRNRNRNHIQVKQGEGPLDPLTEEVSRRLRGG